LFSCGKDRAKDRQKQLEERLSKIRFKSDSLMAYSVPIENPGGAMAYHKLSRKEINDSTIANAANYLNSLVIGLVRTSYQDEGHPVSVEMSQFATFNDAYGFYSRTRPSGAPFDSLGVESYLKNDTLCFTKADYVVIITSTADSNRIEIIRKIGKLINSKLTALSRPPQFFILFPYKGQIVPSQRYYSRNFLGVEGLDSVYTIDYAVDEDTLTLFLSMDTSGSKLVMLSDWGEQFGKINSVPKEIEYASGHAASFTHPELGQFVAGMVGNKLVGVIGYKRPTGIQVVPRWIQGIQ
jgi:hypothetical protein